MVNNNPASVSFPTKPARKAGASGMASLLRRANRKMPAEVPTLRPRFTGACAGCALPPKAVVHRHSGYHTRVRLARGEGPRLLMSFTRLSVGSVSILPER